MAKVEDTWYRITEPGKKEQVVKAGSAPHKKALKDRTRESAATGRPKIVKVISPGSYPPARIDAAGLPSSAWTSEKAKAKPKAADKAKPKGADKSASTKDK